MAKGLEKDIKEVKKSIATMEKDCRVGDTKKNIVRTGNLQKDIDIYGNKQNETVGEI